MSTAAYRMRKQQLASTRADLERLEASIGRPLHEVRAALEQGHVHKTKDGAIEALIRTALRLAEGRS